MCFFVWAFHTGAAPVHRAVFVFTSKQKVQPVDPRGLRFSAATPILRGRAHPARRTRATPPHLPIFLLRTCGPPTSRRDRRDPAKDHSLTQPAMLGTKQEDANQMRLLELDPALLQVDSPLEPEVMRACRHLQLNCSNPTMLLLAGWRPRRKMGSHLQPG